MVVGALVRPPEAEAEKEAMKGRVDEVEMSLDNSGVRVTNVKCRSNNPLKH
jgi:hypothetical protein